MNRTELLIHPLRLRILQHLSVYKEATTNEIISALPEVSKASVYNHIKLLESNHIIQVVRIKQSRKEQWIQCDSDIPAVSFMGFSEILQWSGAGSFWGYAVCRTRLLIADRWRIQTVYRWVWKAVYKIHGEKKHKCKAEKYIYYFFAGLWGGHA